MSRLTNMTLSDLRDISDVNDNVVQRKILDQFAEDLLLTFLNNEETEPLDYQGNLLDCCIEYKDGSIVCYSSSDTLQIISGEDFFLNYDFEINGTHTRQFNDLCITFTKIEFNFLRETWDMSNNSLVKERLVAKMNEYEYENMTLV